MRECLQDWNEPRGEFRRLVAFSRIQRILLLFQMQMDPIAEWRRLTGLYNQMSEIELYELDARREDLTELARQVLRDEIGKRKLPEPTVMAEGKKPFIQIAPPDAANWPFAAGDGDSESILEEDSLPREYTWKTLLCECDEREEAWQIYEVLRRAGIDAWLEGPRSSRSLDVTALRVLVAADQLDRAIEIAKQPIPREIVELSRMEIPEFELPRCPACATEEPVLESVEPANTWRCERCGKQWQDAVESQPSFEA